MASPTVIEAPKDWGTDEWKQERDVYLREWIGDEAAFRLLMDISDITELWDDIVDSDTPLTVERVNQVMLQALVSLPANPFYMQHRGFLTPVIITAINAWLDSNILADGSRSERALAYALRNFDVQVVQAIIYLTRGQAYLRTVSPQLWKLFAAEQDDVLEWIEGKQA